MNDRLGVLQEPKVLLLTTTSVTDVLTMATGVKEINTATLACFANEGASDRTVTLYRTESATDYVIYIGTVGAGQSLEIPILQKLYAKSTARKIRAKASAASEVTVTITYYQSTQQADAGQSG
jgi:hypothetical protein